LVQKDMSDPRPQGLKMYKPQTWGKGY